MTMRMQGVSGMRPLVASRRCPRRSEAQPVSVQMLGPRLEGKLVANVGHSLPSLGVHVLV